MNKAAETVLGGIEKAILKPFGILTDSLTAPLEDRRQMRKQALQSYVDSIEKREDLDPLMKAAFIDNARQILREYSNKSDIVQLAIEKLGDNINNIKAPSEEWLSRFFEEAKHVSKKEIQEIWARILAGELEEPDSIPIKLLRVVAEMDTQQIKLFKIICRFVVPVFRKKDFTKLDNIINPIICPKPCDELFNINLQELENAGLIRENDKEYIFSLRGSYYIMCRETSKIFFEIKNDTLESDVPMAKIKLTELGYKLMNILDIADSEEYLDFDYSGLMAEYWKNNKYVIKHDISELKELSPVFK